MASRSSPLFSLLSSVALVLAASSCGPGEVGELAGASAAEPVPNDPPPHPTRAPSEPVLSLEVHPREQDKRRWPHDVAVSDSGLPVEAGGEVDAGAAVDAGVVLDAGTTRDAGTLDDAGTAVLDAGAPASDAGVTVIDAGMVRDAGVTVIDAGMVRDAGPPVIDAGMVRDAGTPVIDAGTPVIDAGTSGDAGNPVIDAGMVRDAGTPVVDAGTATGGGLWVTGYYPGWTRTSLAPADIDFAALTHLVDFSLHPRPDGTLEDTHNILPSSAATIAAAHAAGVKVLVCIGGANTVSGFQGATNSTRLAAFVDNLVTTVTRSGYDGIDLDWEPLTSADRPQYLALVNALQARLVALTPRRQLTAAVDSWSSSTLTLVADRFDQINVMTYDMAGTGSDWVSWFNSPLSGGGQLRPSGNPLPAADLSVQTFRNNGLAAGKLGIGIAFYGNLWSGGAGTATGGVTAPIQRWTTAPVMSAIDYRTIMSTWYQPGRFHRDPVSQSAWLGVDQPGSVDDHFITYDDEGTIAAKMSWAKSHGLGGVIIWQLGGGYLPTAPPGQRDPLLQAVKMNR